MPLAGIYLIIIIIIIIIKLYCCCLSLNISILQYTLVHW